MRLISSLILSILGVALLVLGVNFYLSPQDELSKADLIVAISGGDTEARTLKAIDLYKQGYAPKLLFSGAALDPLSPSNAKIMKKLATDAGVPEADILLEESAQNTEENAKKSQTVFDSLDYDKIILVTSPYHQRRASLEFRDVLEQDITLINHSSDDKSWPSAWFLTPRGWWLAASESTKIVFTSIKNL